MDAPTVASVEAGLIVAGLLGTAALLVAVANPTTRSAAADLLGGTGTYVAALVAVLATAGSLWFSEVAGFPPCRLCWYQRYAMYPLALLLPLAAIRDSARLRIGALSLACIGLAISVYHNVIETFDGVVTGSCDPTNPCTVRWVQGLGFFTIPRMAAACFVMIIVLTAFDHLTAGQEVSAP